MAQRITRAKQKIKAAESPTGSRGPRNCQARLGVLAVLYLVFNEGYLARRARRCAPTCRAEAIRLTRKLATLMPDEHPARCTGCWP